MNIDGIDKKLLNLVQAEFPLISEPYAGLGLRLDIDENAVIRRITRLKAKGIIRQIGPILDARKLGYQTTLVAMRVAESKLGRAERLISEHSGVSHGYERDHHFNIWFTLAIPHGADMETALQQLVSPIGAEAVFALPAIKLFKLRAYFSMDDNGESTADTGTHTGDILPQKVDLSRIDKTIINELQQDIHISPAPFAAMAQRAGIEIDRFLTQCHSLQQRGIMRRFGASINHNRAGFKANSMTCWIASPDALDVAGQKLAALREVSHCYGRRTNPLWQHNLFAMIHGHTKKACQEIASIVSGETGLTDCIMLFSTRELKKTRVKYLV